MLLARGRASRRLSTSDFRPAVPEQEQSISAQPHKHSRQPKAASRQPAEDLVFPSRTAQPLDITGLLKKLQVYQQRAGIKKRITGHTFRHSLATEMLNRGADLRHIQQLLGHESLNTTQRYLHLVKGELKKIHAHTHPREQLPTAPVRYRGSRRLEP